MPRPSIIDTRRDQMFPVLGPSEVERLRRFGKLRSYPAGDCQEFRVRGRLTIMPG